MNQEQKLTLLLEDGTRITGKSFGYYGETEGEVVFNTSMVGYPEAFTDPSYRGQILTLTYPLIGNYGIPDENKLADNLHENFESSEIQIKALLVTEYSENSSHWTAKISLKDWLKKNKIPAITGIDTRALTQKIREKGAMLGKIILNEKEKLPPKFFDPNNTNLVDEVSIKKPITYKKGQKHVVIIDYGIKNNIIRNFLERNISLTIIPWNYDPFEHNLRFDGLFLTNGPGDPMMIKESCKVVQKAMEKKMPIWGICMGNHILALSAGAKTYKLKYGHRSQNQPCLDLETGRCYITSQNHGYAVDAKTLPKGWKIWLINANDHTVEGIKHASLPFKSVQFHPEATPGPIDTEHFFDDFVKIL